MKLFEKIGHATANVLYRAGKIAGAALRSFTHGFSEGNAAGGKKGKTKKAAK
jgi:hypothetical protein